MGDLVSRDAIAERGAGCVKRRRQWNADDADDHGLTWIKQKTDLV
jgi:hypothetical protein